MESALNKDMFDGVIHSGVSLQLCLLVLILQTGCSAAQSYILAINITCDRDGRDNGYGHTLCTCQPSMAEKKVERERDCVIHGSMCSVVRIVRTVMMMNVID